MRSRLSTYFGGLRGGRAGEAAWVGVSKGVSMCLSLFIAMALSRLMTPDDYGTYLQLLYVYGTLLVVFSLGLPGCYSYFLARVKSAGEGYNRKNEMSCRGKTKRSRLSRLKKC